MRSVLRLVDFLSSRFGETPSVFPNLTKNLLAEAERVGCPLAVKVFLIKVVLNRPAAFRSEAASWVAVLVDYASLAENGGQGFHYFLRDVCTTMIDWWAMNPELGERLGYQEQSEQKKRLCAVLNRLIPLCASDNTELFRTNVAILRSLLRF